MAGIFLSYSREDRRCAEQIARILGKAGHEVWWDRHIDTGREFASEIESQLAKADVVLVAWSASAAKSPWVRDEAAIGRDRGRLLPVLVDGGEPPIGFRQFQALDLSGWKGRANDRRTRALVDAVDAMRRGSAPPAVWPRRGSAWLREKRAWALAGALALIAAAAIVLLIVRPGAAEAEPASLAVLPFRNMASGDSYFAEGVAEEIADQLSHEPQFKVAGRTSSTLFKEAADLKDVGRRLHVAYVLEGSVRSVGNEVRVVVALVDARQGKRLWSQDFRGSLNDIFAIQDQIGQQVAAHVKRQLILRVPSLATTTRGDVYSLYVTGRSLMNLREPAKIAAAVGVLKRAVELDSNYAPAWAQLALATNLADFYGHEDEARSPAARADSLRYAQRATALAPGFGRAHAVLGALLVNDDATAEEMRRGRVELERSVQLDPNDAEAWYWLHFPRLKNLDFAGALQAMQHTAEIDPFFVFSEYYPNLAWDMGDHQAAIGFLMRRATDHPVAYIREEARAQAARLQNDWSAAYQHAKAARAIAPPDMKAYDESRMASALLQLRLLDQAEKYVPRAIVDMRRGKLTFRISFRDAFPGAEFWSFNADEEHLMPKLLVKLGRSRELVAAYDQSFSSPDDMATRYTHYGFVLNAPLLAIALRQANRGREGVRIIILADRMCRTALLRQQSPVSFRVMCSRVAALAGRKDEAIRSLEQAVSEGWRPSEGEYPAVTDEPGYAGIRTDPRMKRIDSIIAANAERERRELLAAGV
jgi:TolB-like protein